MQQRWLIFLISLMACGLLNAQAWRLEGVELSQQKEQTQVNISSLIWAEEEIKNINYVCDEAVPIFPEHHCQQASVTAQWQGIDWYFKLDSFLALESGDARIHAELFNNQLGIEIDENIDVIKIQFDQLHTDQLVDFLPKILLQSLKANLSGEASFDVEQQLFESEQLEMTLSEAAYGFDYVLSQAKGLLDVSVSAKNLNATLNWHIEQGEALLGPVYVDFSSFPVTLTGQIAMDGGAGWAIKIHALQKNSMEADLIISLDEQGGLTQAKLSGTVHNAKTLNENMLSAVLDLYGFKQTEMEGGFEFGMQYDGEKITQGHVKFNDLYLENAQRKVSFSALNGTVHWHHKDTIASKLSWQSMLLAGMPVGASNVEFQFFDDEFLIIGKPEWPVFDGSIQVNQWHVSHLFSEYVDMEVSAEIMPMSLLLVTEKMGWPSMSGTLSGHIPEVVKKGSIIELKGGLDLQVFEGTMRFNQLSTERLFGVAPVIAGNVAFETLNLGQLTETFDFGKITGLLSGAVNNLRITNWKTDRMAAEIYTVEQKGVKQTISQQAIDHISSLGGIQGALSRTFLRFFDDFKYKKIKLSCVLHNAVCQIGGINNTSNQFTIVEGGGIPKINIVGFVREVDWDTFISRLLNANYD